MDEDIRTRAETRYAAALEAARLRDPREQFRGWMRRLREENRIAFEKARRHYDDHLVPRTAEGDSDPIAEWIEYGRLLADSIAPGRSFAVDGTGRASPYGATPAAGGDAAGSEPPLVLHIPDEPAADVSVLSLPKEPSAAQRATVDLLVTGRREPARAADPS